MCILLNVKKHEKTFALNVDIFNKCREHCNAEPRAWHTVTARIRRKATQWNKRPLGLFYCLNGADLKAKEKTGAMITPAER